MIRDFFGSFFDVNQVRDSKGGILSQKENLGHQAKSSFTSEIYDNYEICLISRVSPSKFWNKKKKKLFSIQFLTVSHFIFNDRYS